MKRVSKETKQDIKLQYNVGTLLSKGNTNSKTAKNETITYIMYVAPHKLGGKNVCSNASKGCIEACLFSAGRGKFSNVWGARLNKAKFLASDFKLFVNLLADEIERAIKLSKGSKVQFRLNGTSDLDFLHLLKVYAGFDYQNTPSNVYFYDYTPNLTRAIKYKDDPKYFVTFSRKEDNHTKVLEAIKQGINIAAVFNALPDFWQGVKVIDGDKADDLMTHHKGVILGLKAKGDAKKDTTGFVITEDTPKALFNSLEPYDKNLNNSMLVSELQNLRAN